MYYNKASECVDHEILWIILKIMGVVIRLLMYYNKASECVDHEILLIILKIIGDTSTSVLQEGFRMRRS